MKKFRGYIFSRPFMGERVPQHVQNMVIRDYCDRNNLQFLLSAAEYAMPESHLIHEQVMDELSEIDGVVAYSLYQLPEDNIQRHKIYSKVINMKKVYCFAVENIKIASKHDCERIESIWQVKKTLPYCYLA
jgi:sporadic carbohydrate cluster protein (TIGR04323 family)